MPPAIWILLGACIGCIALLPVIRLLLRRAETRAREAERRARESERLAELGSMTGGLAHEIKNPLSTIGLNAQLLAEGLHEADMPDEQRERLLRRMEALGREAERLRGILTDFLQFAGRIKLAPEPHDVVRIVEEVVDFFHPQCDQAHVLLRTQLPDAPAVVDLDDGLFKQALLNLMLNAVQAMRPSDASAGDAPAPELIVRVNADDAAVEVHVIDTGPGIDPEALETIFHPYVSGKGTGTGLGLPTARRIVEEHGGRLLANSSVGRGSEFVIRLPRRRE
ncbi:MAG: HAMP domain-containing histidine kinase [Phycisphaerales bacterium]|nr:HAMP domain-containing histidine kinase [Phycisphaerales bacterium]